MRLSIPAAAAAALLLSACTGAREAAHPPMPAPAPPAVTEAHYRVFTGDGRPATLDDVAAAMAEADVVFVGESHDDPAGHVLEARLLEAAFARYGASRRVALSLEMFARDVQHIVDEYLDSLITEPHFLASAGPWDNYQADYRPMVEFARAHGLDVVAANAPRRYVNRVSRLGPASLDVLGARAKEALPPLPYPGPSPAYQAKWNRLMQEAMAAHGGSQHSAAPADTSQAGTSHAGAHGHAMPEVSNMLHAQALWDAAMGHSIATYLAAHPGALVVHVVGGFHVEAGTGTPEAFQVYRPGTRTLNVALRPADDVAAFSDAFAGHGDFVIQTDAGLPRSFTR